MAYSHEPSKNVHDGNVYCTPKTVPPRVGIEVRVPVASTNNTPYRSAAFHSSSNHAGTPSVCTNREVQYQRDYQTPSASKIATEPVSSHATSNSKAIHLANGKPHSSNQVLSGQLPPTPTSRLTNGHVSNGSNGARAITTNPSKESYLLLLADMYFGEACRIGSVASTAQQDLEMYQKLIATGLGCLEAVLMVSTTRINVTCRIPVVKTTNWK